MPVIKDVAKLAGVSVGSVSKYLNNNKTLKASTRQKIISAIEELNYKPNPLARSMRTGRTNIIAVIVPDITNPFFAETFNSIRIEAHNNDYTTVLYTSTDNPDRLQQYLSGETVNHPDGVILCFVDEGMLLDRFAESLVPDAPVVLLSWDLNNVRYNSIAIDVAEGIYKSTNHMVNIGRKKIAYIGGPEASHISIDKLSGYKRALEESGFEIDCSIIYQGENYNLSTGYEAARIFTRQDNIPDSIVTANDALALGCMKYLMQKGIKIPDNIAVIGFDNVSLSSMYEPSLSTVSIPIKKMGEEAIKMLHSEISNPSEFEHKKQIILDTQLVIRRSTSAGSI